MEKERGDRRRVAEGVGKISAANCHLEVLYKNNLN